MKKTINSYFIFKQFILWFGSLACIIPFILLIMASITDNGWIALHGYSFFPGEFSLEAYRFLFAHGGTIMRAYGVAIFVTVIGTTAGLSMTLMLAWPMSRPDLPGRKIISLYVLFTLLFNGGLVPTFLVWTTMFGIGNTIWAQLLPNLLVRAFFVIMARSYFMTSIPLEIIESSRMDGAGEFGIFMRIVLPLSKPIISTLALFIGLAYWNDWSNGLIYIQDTSLFNIQNVMNEMIRNIQALAAMGGSVTSTATMPSNTVRMAIAVIGVLPVLAVYPFLQRGFVKGIVMGGVKG